MSFSKETFHFESLCPFLCVKMLVSLSKILMSLVSVNVLWLNKNDISESEISELSVKTESFSLGSGRT